MAEKLAFPWAVGLVGPHGVDSKFFQHHSFFHVMSQNDGFLTNIIRVYCLFRLLDFD